MDGQLTEDITVVTIVDALRGSIVRGELAPGSVINSVDIAQQFGTSRTPVREALLVLSQYGLITLAARRRPQVAPVSAKAIRDLYALRTALHAYISDAIVQNASGEQLKALRAQAAVLLDDKAGHGSEEHMLHIEAYLAAEAQLCGNPLVIGVLDSLKWKIGWFRRLGMMSAAQLKLLAADLLRIADAYLERDARLADALNRSMLRKAGDYCERNFVAAQAPTGEATTPA
jgi:DNA-binding GntR family transcriptional regulator